MKNISNRLKSVTFVVASLMILTDIKVKDYCHINGKYRGLAHQSCNLNFVTVINKLPVY